MRKLTFTGSTEIGKLLMEAVRRHGEKDLAGTRAATPPSSCSMTPIWTRRCVGAMASKYRNAGQTCVCANRILVQESVFDAFAEKLVAAVKALKVGNGADEGVTIGPLINDDAFDKVSAIVDQATANGAVVLTGGKGTAAKGENFYEPTVLVERGRQHGRLQRGNFRPDSAAVQV